MEEFKNFVRSYFPRFPNAKHLWKSLLTLRRNDGKMCKKASLVMSISSSSSKVERTFITVRNALSDKSHSILHSTLNDNLIVYGNNPLCNNDEEEESIERAVDLYLKTKQKMNINIQESIKTSKLRNKSTPFYGSMS